MGFTVTEETKGKIGPILLRLVTTAYGVRGYKMDVTDWDALTEQDQAGYMEFANEIVVEIYADGVFDPLLAAALAEGDATPPVRNPLACEICGKVARSTRGLNMHVKGMHAEEPVPA